MDDNGTDVIRVGFKRCDLLRGIVVVDSKLEVIGATDNPILACNEASCPYRDICKLEGLDNSLLASACQTTQLFRDSTCVSNDHILTCPRNPRY